MKGGGDKWSFLWRKSNWQNSTLFHDKNTWKTRYRRTLPQHNKSHRLKIHSEHNIPCWWKTENFSSKMRNKAKMPASPLASLVVPSVKSWPAMKETWVWSLCREDPLENEMAAHSSMLAWEIPWTEEPDGLHTVHGVVRVGHDLATKPPLLLNIVLEVLVRAMRQEKSKRHANRKGKTKIIYLR